jgi:fucose permease
MSATATASPVRDGEKAQASNKAVGNEAVNEKSPLEQEGTLKKEFHHSPTSSEDQTSTLTGEKNVAVTSATEGTDVERVSTTRATATGEEVVEDESKYPHGFTLVMIMVGLALVCFVVALDNTIIATAIPTITTHFNSLTDVGWYGSAYLLTTTSLQPSFGKIYTYFSVKWTFLVAIILFELGSTLCAAATSSPMLIVGRAVAGCGASGLFSGSMTIIGYAVPLRKRALYIACLSSMFGIASIIGPIIGGALTDKASWRWYASCIITRIRKSGQ